MWMETLQLPPRTCPAPTFSPPTTSSPHQPCPAPHHPPSVSGRCEPPPTPAGHLNPLDTARCSCLFINWILKTFLTNSSNKVCPDTFRPLYGLFPGQWRDHVEDSRRLSHKVPGARLGSSRGSC